MFYIYIDWFTSRISAAGSFAMIYLRIPAQQRDQLRELFCKLCRDETPMVRRAACAHIGAFCSVVEQQYIVNDIVRPFTGLAQDEQVLYFPR